MQYAVIKSGGKQYKVNVGDELTLDKLSLADKKTIIFDEVLLLVNDGKVEIGKPNVKNVKVEAKLIEEKKGDKIRIVKFKAKSRYRKTIGFRPKLSVVKIEKIDFGTKRVYKEIEEPTKTAPKRSKKVEKDIV